MFLLATAAVIVWIIVWLVVAYRVIQRHDLGVAAKVLWILLILLFPIVGLLVYFLWDAARPRTSSAGSAHAPERNDVCVGCRLPGLAQRVGRCHDLVAWKRSPEIVALAEVAPCGTQVREVCSRLDPLGDDLQSEAGSELDRRRDDRLVTAVGLHARNERAVDLQHVRRERLQLTERRVADPKSSIAMRMP